MDANKYDQNKYNKNFFEKHKEKINEQHICDICLGVYKYYTKSKHIQTKRHLYFLDKKNNIANQDINNDNHDE